MTLQERIDAAQAAYDALLRGEAPRVVVDQNGERIEYVMASADRLLAYIEKLLAEQAAGGARRSRGR